MMQTTGAAVPRRVDGAAAKAIIETINRDTLCRLEEEGLLRCLLAGDAREWPDHVLRFFQEVRPHMAVSFAEDHGITRMKLVEAYETVKAATGRRAHAFEQALRGEFVFTS